MDIDPFPFGSSWLIYRYLCIYIYIHIEDCCPWCWRPDPSSSPMTIWGFYNRCGGILADDMGLGCPGRTRPPSVVEKVCEVCQENYSLLVRKFSWQFSIDWSELGYPKHQWFPSIFPTSINISGYFWVHSCIFLLLTTPSSASSYPDLQSCIASISLWLCSIHTRKDEPKLMRLMSMHLALFLDNAIIPWNIFDHKKCIT